MILREKWVVVAVLGYGVPKPSCSYLEVSDGTKRTGHPTIPSRREKSQRSQRDI